MVLSDGISFNIFLKELMPFSVINRQLKLTLTGAGFANRQKNGFLPNFSPHNEINPISLDLSFQGL